MDLLTDAKKAYRLISRAAASRAAVQRVRRRIEPQEGGRFRIAVYFADSVVNMYQIRQWYRPLEGLAEQWPVVVLARDPLHVPAGVGHADQESVGEQRHDSLISGEPPA